MEINKFSTPVKELCVGNGMQPFQMIHDHVLRRFDKKIKPFLSLKLTVNVLSNSVFTGKIRKLYIICGQHY